VAKPSVYGRIVAERANRAPNRLSQIDMRMPLNRSSVLTIAD
jgi:hypothetical protein